MISQARRWSYANARLRYYIGNLAGHVFFSELVNKSPNDVLAGLAATPPAGIEWPDITEKSDNICPLLYRAYEDHFLRLTSFLPAPLQEYVILSLDHVVIYDLQLLIRHIVGKHITPDHREVAFITLGTPTSPARPASTDSKAKSTLPVDVTGVTTLEQLEAALARTPFATPYSRARKVYEKEGDVLAFEAALSLDYLRRLEKAISNIPACDRLGLRRLFRHRCDIKNLGWILRYRFNYELSEVEIFNYASSFGLELNDDIVMALAGAGTLNSAIETIAHLPMGRFIKATIAAERPDALKVIDVEEALEQYWEHIHRTALCGPPFGLLPFAAYLSLKEREMERVRRVITGKQLGLDPKRIMNGLLLPPEAS